jgi:ribosomal-protein-alanine N-acetyltransferase
LHQAARIRGLGVCAEISNSLRKTLHATRRVLDRAEGSRYMSSHDEQLVLCPNGDLWVDVEAFKEAAAARNNDGYRRDSSMRLDCGCCVLRPWREGDEPSLVRHANNYEVWRRLRDSFPHPYTLADAKRWIAFAKQQNPQTYFAIEVHGGATGGIGLEPRSDIERRSAEMGYWLGQEFWGKGITTAAVRAVTSYGFEALNLTRIFAVPFASSSASIRVLEKCGYVREGTMRRSAIKEGVVMDQVLYALTDRDLSRML